MEEIMQQELDSPDSMMGLAMPLATDGLTPRREGGFNFRCSPSLTLVSNSGGLGTDNDELPSMRSSSLQSTGSLASSSLVGRHIVVDAKERARRAHTKDRVIQMRHEEAERRQQEYAAKEARLEGRKRAQGEAMTNNTLRAAWAPIIAFLTSARAWPLKRAREERTQLLMVLYAPFVRLRLRRWVRHLRARRALPTSAKPTVETLRADQVLALFPQAQLEHLIQLMSLRYYFPNEPLIFSGCSDEEECYVLCRGKADVLVNGKCVHTFTNAGSVFGSVGMVSGEPRTATVTARAPDDDGVLVWVGTRTHFESFHNNEDSSNDSMVSAATATEHNVVAELREKNFRAVYKRQLSGAYLQSHFAELLRGLRTETIDNFVANSTPHAFNAGAAIARAGGDRDRKSAPLSVAYVLRGRIVVRVRKGDVLPLNISAEELIRTSFMTGCGVGVLPDSRGTTTVNVNGDDNNNNVELAPLIATLRALQMSHSTQRSPQTSHHHMQRNSSSGGVGGIGDVSLTSLHDVLATSNSLSATTTPATSAAIAVFPAVSQRMLTFPSMSPSPPLTPRHQQPCALSTKFVVTEDTVIGEVTAPVVVNAQLIVFADAPSYFEVHTANRGADVVLLRRTTALQEDVLELDAMRQNVMRLQAQLLKPLGAKQILRAVFKDVRSVLPVLRQARGNDLLPTMQPLVLRPGDTLQCRNNHNSAALLSTTIATTSTPTTKAVDAFCYLVVSGELELTESTTIKPTEPSCPVLWPTLAVSYLGNTIVSTARAVTRAEVFRFQRTELVELVKRQCESVGGGTSSCGGGGGASTTSLAVLGERLTQMLYTQTGHMPTSVPSATEGTAQAAGGLLRVPTATDDIEVESGGCLDVVKH